MNIIELTFLIIQQVGTVTRLLSDSDSCPTATLVRQHYFLLFKVITQTWDIKIDPNLHRLFVINLCYYLESFKKIVQLDLQIYALVPLQTTYLEIFFVFKVISQIWHIELRPNLHKLSVL